MFPSFDFLHGNGSIDSRIKESHKEYLHGILLNVTIHEMYFVTNILRDSGTSDAHDNRKRFRKISGVTFSSSLVTVGLLGITHRNYS